MPNSANRSPILDQRDKWLKELVQDKDPQCLREKLAAMAHALQMGLSDFASRDAVPHASALEVIMRAVAHDIEGDNKNYVRQKLDIGYQQLITELG